MMFNPGPKMQAMMARGARCAECPLAPFENGPVFSELRPGMPICVLAEAPNGDEVDQGRPLVGRTGDVLWDALGAEGFRRSETSQIDTVACRPPVINGQPVSLNDFVSRLPKGTLSPIDACRTRFIADVEEAKPQGFLILGEKALEATAQFLNVAYRPKEVQIGVPFIGSMAKTQGAPIVLPREHIVYDGSKLETKLSLPPDRPTMISLATYHPAFAMRAKEFLRPVRSFIARGARLIWDGKIKWSAAPILLLLDLDEDEAFQRVLELHRLVLQNKDHVWLTSDLETDGIEHEFLNIRCFGFHVDTDDASLPEFAVVVPWIYRDGRRFWHKYERQVRQLLRELYDSCRLVFHNGGPFDTRVLINNDFLFDSSRHFDLLREQGTPQEVIDMMPVPVRKLWFDTRIAHRATRDTDLPHDLDFCTTRYFDAPKWKHEADAKDARGVKTDHALHFYCGTDVTATGRLRPQMTQEIALFDTVDQFTKDAELDAMYREMSRMGLCIDEVFRGEASKRYHELVYKLRRGFQAVVERISPGFKDINPGSWQQLGRWIYDELGLTPEMTSGGRPWSPGLPRSTRYDAIQLVEQNQLIQAARTDPKMKMIRQAFDYLLKYKVSKKLLSSFIDGIPVRSWADFAGLEGPRPTLDYVGPMMGRAPAVDFGFMYRDEDEDDANAEFVQITSLPERDAWSILFATFMLTPPSGRLSSQPNVQNWPNVGYGGLETRKMIHAAPGHVLLASDYKQIEQRIYVVISGDELLQRCYDEGLDPHTFNTATLLMKEKYSWEAALREYARIDALDKKAKKSIRNVGKTTQYAEAYGVEEDKIGDFFLTARDKSTGNLQFPDMTAEKAEYLHNKWHELHPETRRWQAAIAKELAMKKFIDTIFLHRKRAFPDGATKKNAPGNHRVQGCHPKDELVLTDRGYITFGQALVLSAEKPAPLGENEVVPPAPKDPPGGPLLAWTGTAWSRARVLEMGEDERVELHLDNGSIILCDTRERVKKLEDDGATWTWHWLVDLKPDDIIATCQSRAFNIGSRWPGWEREDAYWLGYLHGGAWSESPLKNVRRDRYQRATVVGGLREATVIGFDIKRNLGRAVVPFGDPPDPRFDRLVGRAERWVDNRVSAVLTKTYYDFALDSWSPRDESAPELASHARFVLQTAQLDEYFGRKGWSEWRDIDETQRRLLWKAAPYRQAYLDGYLESLAEPTQLVLRLAESVGLVEETVVGAYACARIVEIVRTGKREPMYTLSVDHDDHSYVCSSLVSKNSAGDLVNDAAQRVVEAIPFRKWSRWSGLVDQIHDQLVVQVPENRAYEAKAIMTKVMPASMPGMKFEIDEVQIGLTLGDV